MRAMWRRACLPRCTRSGRDRADAAARADRADKRRLRSPRHLNPRSPAAGVPPSAALAVGAGLAGNRLSAPSGCCPGRRCCEEASCLASAAFQMLSGSDQAGLGGCVELSCGQGRASCCVEHEPSPVAQPWIVGVSATPVKDATGTSAHQRGAAGSDLAVGFLPASCAFSGDVERRSCITKAGHETLGTAAPAPQLEASWCSRVFADLFIELFKGSRAPIGAEVLVRPCLCGCAQPG